MLTPFARIFLLVLLTIIPYRNLAQSDQETTLLITVQRTGDAIEFFAPREISGFRAEVYDQQGNLIADSGKEAKQQWGRKTPKELPPNVYLCIFWLRGTEGVTKRIARLEVTTKTQRLQSAEQYLAEVAPPDSVYWGSPEYRAAERRAYQRGIAAIPFFRTAIKVMPDESAAYLFFVQAIRTKYAMFHMATLAPPPPPPPPPPPSIRTKATRRTRPSATPAPTAQEKQEMLAATQKAVAVAKACAEKTTALQWLASVQGELEQRDAQVATLEQIAQASCATSEIKARVWYTSGVIQWQCAYDLTTRYADPAQLTNAPFHYRNIKNPADQQQAATCVQKGAEAIDKALALAPDYAEAWSYRSLLLREKQKLTAAPEEQQKYAALANEAVRRALDLYAKQREQK